MKSFELFKAGKHTSASGVALDFTEDHLRAAVTAYDPALHEAPIVVGHPKENAPAYGWVKSLSYADGMISAEPTQVDATFEEMVQAGRFKKRSASFYTPDAPNNPTPGTYYLRHVGFLGAQPPAVKGLKDVAFADEDHAVEVEFADGNQWAWGSIASALRGLREWLISKHGLDTADKVMPGYVINDIDAAARTPPAPPAEAASYPNFSEDETMDQKELQSQVATLTAANATLATEKASLTTELDTLKTQAAAQTAKDANFAEQDTALKAREAAVVAAEAKIARASVEARLEAAVKAGRMLPKAKTGAINFAMSLADTDAILDFGEGDQAKKVTLREAYLLQLEAGPTLVDFSERAVAGDPPDASALSPQAIADKARDIVKKAEADGKAVSFTEAVAQATAEIAG